MRSERKPQRSPEHVFSLAMEKHGQERLSFLRTECSHSPELLAEIIEMCKLADRQPALLEPPDTIPKQLGKYEVTEELGRGAMGIVYRAIDTHLGREVALKVLPDRLVRDGKAQARFDREARILASLNAPGIATLFSLEESNGVRYLVMEYVAGVTLREVLETRRPTAEESIDWVRQIASSLTLAHSQGVIHRDLKPENVILQTNGQIKVVDFGIARALEEPPDTERIMGTSARSTSLVGTPSYMSPEQFTGEQLDPRSDIFSIGCILFESLAGQRLFPDGTFGSKADPTLLEQVSNQRLRTLVSDCVSLNPSRRPESAIALLDRLDHNTRLRLPIAILSLLLVVLASLAVWATTARDGRTPIAFEPSDPNTITARDEGGNTVWIRRFDEVVGSISRLGQAKAGFVVVPREDEPSLITARLGRDQLTAISQRDGATLWELGVEWDEPVNGNGGAYYLWDTVAERLDGSRVIATCLRDGPWYSTCVQFLELDGRRAGAYYHPGVLSSLGQPVTYEDGERPLIVFGNNSSARFQRDLVPFETNMHAGVVAAISPNTSGQAYPYSQGMSQERDWPGMPRAVEQYYLVIPPLDPSTAARVQSVTVAQSDGGTNFELNLEDGRFLLIDSRLRPIRAYSTLGKPADKLIQSGEAIMGPVLYLDRGVPEFIELEYVN